MLLPYTKWIPVEEAVIGEKYSGYAYYEDGELYYHEWNFSCNDVTYIGNNKLDNGMKVVKVNKRLDYEEQESYVKESFDLKDKKAQLCLFGLFTDFSNIGDAGHIMWNAWIGNDFYKVYYKILDEDFTIAGIAPAPWAPDIMKNPVAIICEYSNGIRVWCHAEKEWVETMREQMKSTYNLMLEGNI